MNPLLSSICAKNRSLAFAPDDNSAGLVALEHHAKLGAVGAEEFSTLYWVRCRRESTDTAQTKVEVVGKSIGIIKLQKTCDEFTWHWVCNHNQWIVPIRGTRTIPVQRGHEE